jgi:hypothetical protein
LVEYGFKVKKRSPPARTAKVQVDSRLATVRRDLVDQYGGLRVLTDSRKISKM